MNKKRRGFTLVELLVVLLILGVLVGLAVPRYMESQKTARARTFAANVRQIVSALEAYKMDHSVGSDAKYPDNLEKLKTKYFTQEPINPYTGTSMLNATSATSATFGITYEQVDGGASYKLQIIQKDVDKIGTATNGYLCNVPEVSTMFPAEGTNVFCPANP